MHVTFTRRCSEKKTAPFSWRCRARWFLRECAHIVTDLIRNHLVDVIVSTGACMVHDAIEAVGGHHYKGGWAVNDAELYKYHIFRIYDIFVPEEDYVRLDFKFSEMYADIAKQRKGESLASDEFTYEIGKRLTDKNSILRAAYEENVPIFLPAVRDSEFGFIHWLHASQKDQKNVLLVDAFKDVPTICGICSKITKKRHDSYRWRSSTKHNSIVCTCIQKRLRLRIVITLDRPETGGLSGSTLEETVSWGKMKGSADHVMVIGEALMVFPFLVASATERLGPDFKRNSFLQREKLAGKGN